MKNFLQKARLFLTSIEHSKYFTILLVFIIAFAAGIVIVASQQQTQKQAEKTTTEPQTEPLFMVDPGEDGNGCVKTVGSIELKECSTVACGKRVKWTYRCDGSHTVSHITDSSCNCLSCCTGASNSAPGDCIVNDSRCLGKNQGATCATNYKCLSPSKNDTGNCKFYDSSGNCLTSASCYGTTNCGGCAYSGYDCISLKTGQGFPYACCPKTTTEPGTTNPGSGGGTGGGGSTGGGGTTQGNTSCSRCSDTYKNVRANWQEGDSTCDRSNVTSSTTYSLDCTCINDTQYGNKATLPSSDKNINSSVCSPRCSDTYQYCKANWQCSTPDCSDTWNAKYVKDCSCTQGGSNCSTKGVDTSSCSIDTSKTVPPPPDGGTPFDCTGTKEGHNWKCETTCDAASGWSSSAYNNMPAKTTCQKDGKICCKQNTTTTPQIPDCDSGIQYGDCTGAPTNTCSQDNGTRTITYTTLNSGGQCNQKSLYNQACTQNNCSFNYTCNSGQCVTVTTGGGNNGGGGNTSTCGNGTCESNENATSCPSDCGSTGGGGGTRTNTATILTFNLGLDGIGSAGDHINPDATDSNKNPKTTTRKVIVSVLDSTGTVAENTVDASYNSGSGKLSLSVDLGTSLSKGVYTIKAKSDGYLRKNLSTTQNITAGQTNTLPDANLIVGDINNDNIINVLDYNILISCSIFAKDNGTLCNQKGVNKTLSDLDDDGTVNQYDYSLFVREFSAQKGD